MAPEFGIVRAISILRNWRECWEKNGKFATLAKLAEACYDKGVLISAVQNKIAKGWKAYQNWIPTDKTGTRADFTNVPMLIAEAPGGVLKFDFEVNAVGIAVASGLDAGIIEYRIDKGEWKTRDLFTQWSSQLHLPWFHTLHTV